MCVPGELAQDPCHPITTQGPRPAWLTLGAVTTATWLGLVLSHGKGPAQLAPGFSLGMDR